MIFLIEYSRGDGRIISLTRFNESDRLAAAAQRLAIEVDLNRQGVMDHEVLLLEAEDEEALRFTHGRYFWNLEELARSMERAR